MSPASASPRTLASIILIHGLDPRTPVSALMAFLSPLVNWGHPVALSIDPHLWLKVAHEDRSALVAALKALILQYPNHTGIFPYVEALNDLPGYSQERAAYEARKALAEVFETDDPGDQLHRQLTTIVSGASTNEFIPEGLTAAGFRNMLVVPAKTGDLRFEAYENGTLRTFGGIRHEIGEPVSDLGKMVDRQLARDPVLILHLDAARLLQLNDSSADRSGLEVLEKLSGFAEEYRIAPTRIASLHAASRPDFKRSILVMADLRGARNAGRADLARRFAEDAVPLGLILDRGGDVAPDPGCTFVTAPEAVASASGAPPPRPEPLSAGDCIVHTINAIDEPAVNTELLPSYLAGTGPTLAGLDGDANLRLGPVLRIEDQSDILTLAHRIGDYRDVVLLLGPEVLDDAAMLDDLRGRLLEMRDEGSTAYIDLPGWVARALPSDPVFTKFRRHRRMADETAPHVEEPDAKEREHLLADAAVAWRYFEVYVHTQSGLVPATVGQPNPRVTNSYETLTMWDIGSYLLALEAVRALDIIDQPTFLSRTRQVIAALPETVIDGLTLPCSLISSLTAKPESKDFNRCDFGRLLAALARLNKHAELTETVTAKVAAWDIAEALAGGPLKTFAPETTVFDGPSHCSHYLARSLRSFGFETSSPYSHAYSGYHLADRRMSLLYAAGRIGSLGAEPLLLEIIELGASPEASWLAEILFTEQYNAHKSDGGLYCVSEVPINEAPWFLYLGLDMSSEARRWVLETTPSDQKYDPAKLRARYGQMMSVKSAFLWQAVHPHAYSTKLVQHMRDHARIPEMGYASGAFFNSEDITDNYTDVNTNAIILQAIAHRLAGTG